MRTLSTRAPSNSFHSVFTVFPWSPSIRRTTDSRSGSTAAATASRWAAGRSVMSAAVLVKRVK